MEYRKGFKGGHVNDLPFRKQVVAQHIGLNLSALGRTNGYSNKIRIFGEHCNPKHTDSLSVSSTLPNRLRKNFKENIVQRRSISSISEYSKPSLFSSKIFHTISIKRLDHLFYDKLSTQHHFRVLNWKKQQLGKIYQRREILKNCIFSVRLRKHHLMRLLREKRQLNEASSNSSYYSQDAIHCPKRTNTDEAAVCHARAQALRRRLIEGVAAARQHSFQEKLRKAMIIRKESQIIRLLVNEMKERDIRWKQRLRRRVLTTRSRHTSKKSVSRYPLHVAKSSYADDDNLNELQEELKFALAQENVLNDELLELKELLECLTHRAVQKY